MQALGLFAKTLENTSCENPTMPRYRGAFGSHGVLFIVAQISQL